MAGYIGQEPANKFLTLDKQTFTTSATDTYSLDKTVSSANEIELFLNNVRQEPIEAYTVSGNTLTLASAISASDTMYCIYQGKAIGSISPATNSVSNDMLQGSIATSKLADITANGITEADHWELTAMTSGSANPISSNLARTTGLAGYKGTGMSVSSGIWTFPSTGYWYVSFQAQLDEQGGLANNIDLDILHSTNGGSFWSFNTRATERLDNVSNSKGRATLTTLLKISDTSNDVIRFDVSYVNASNRIMGTAGSRYTTFLFIKLGEL